MPYRLCPDWSCSGTQSGKANIINNQPTPSWLGANFGHNAKPNRVLVTVAWLEATKGGPAP